MKKSLTPLPPLHGLERGSKEVRLRGGQDARGPKVPTTNGTRIHE